MRSLPPPPSRVQAAPARTTSLILAALLGSTAASVHAQPTPAPVPAAPTPPAAAGEDVVEMMEFFVQERGVSRATSTIAERDIDVALPGANVIQLLRNVPGFNITTTDPFGFAPEGGDVRLRAFPIGVIAISVDGVPMASNNGRYGTPSSRIVDSENLASIQVSAGTGDVTTPAFEALGGSIQYYTKDPSPVMAAHILHTFGSWDYKRTFARFDTGEILPGLTAFVSTSQFAFKTLGMPEDSQVEKLDVRVRYQLDRTTFNYAFTHHDRDDYDSARSIRWDYWRAMETGDPFAGYDRARYLTTPTGSTLNAEGNSLTEFARLGFGEYTATNAPLLTASLRKDYGDTGRNAVRRTNLDSSVNLGDEPNSSYYYYGRNGRIDDFSRFIVDHSFTDNLVGKFIGYYQDKQYYGTAYQPRSSVIGVIRSAYIPANNTTGALREDIWARYAYVMPGATANSPLVPYGTPGARPVGFTDSNGNGFFDPGEKLDPAKTVTAFTATGASAHALVTPTSTTVANATTAIPGSTARDEEFGGYRWGLFPKAVWHLDTPIGQHKLTAGIWYEKDVQFTERPHFNLFDGSPTGDFLYDQQLFTNYERFFLTESTQIFIEDVSRWFDDRLTVTLGAKSLNVDRSVEGMIDSSLFVRPEGQRFARNEATYKDNFLPQAGATFKLSPSYELFASYAVNIAAPTQDVITSLGFNDGLLPEKATNYEFGVRHSSSAIDVQLALYYNAYEERLLTVNLTTEELNALGISGFVGTSIYRNVGGIDSQGAELSFDWRTPIKRLSLTGSVAYQNSEFAQDLRVSYQAFMGNPNDPRSQFYSVIPVTSGTPQFAIEKQAGKSQGNTPELTVQLDAFYRWKNFAVNFGGRYYDEVWANSMNTELVPSYTVFNAGVRISGSKGTKLEPFSIDLRATNVFDQYIFTSGAGTGAFDGTVTADYGRTLLVSVEAKF